MTCTCYCVGRFYWSILFAFHLMCWVG